MQFKSIITTFLGCVAYASVSTQALAQAPTVWDNCPSNGILTNPSAPVNPQNPAQINTFNWQSTIFPFNGTGTIPSPFFQRQNNLAEPLRNTQDQKNSEGWELITQGFGFLSPGVPNPEPETYPYYILYNKHTAIMRVFVAGAAKILANFNAYQIRLGFADNSHQSSLLMLANEPAAIFDKFIRGQKLLSGTDFNNYNKLWVYADFPMTYDPCACNFKSRIYVDLQLITTSQIKMVGISQGTLTNIANGSGTINQEESKWTLQNAIGAGKKASETFNSIGSFTNKQLTELEKAKHDDKTELPLLTAKEKQDAFNAFQKALFKNDFLKDGLKALPYIGAAVSFLDSFFGGGASSPQEVKLMPMAINMTTTFEGTIETRVPDRPILIDNPGTKDAGIAPSFDSEYPVYNEAMGNFTVLTLPKIEKIKHQYIFLPISLLVEYGMLYKFPTNLQTDLKYVLNPASGLNADNIEIKAALVFDFEQRPQEWVKSLNENLELEAKTPTTIRYRSPYMPLSMINDATAQYGFSLRDSIYTYPGTIITVPMGKFVAPKDVYLKIIVNLKRNNATPETQNILYVQTYKLGENYSIRQTPAMPIIPAESKIPENIYFRTGQIISSNGFDTKYAWGSLIVQAGVSYTPYVTNRYTCLGGVFYEDGAMPIPISYIIYQEFPFANIPPYQKFTPQATSAFIQSACATTYKNQIQRWSKAEKIGDVGVEELKAGVEKSEDFVAFPNPANSEVTIRYQIEQQGNVEISITDMLGRVVFEPIVSQNHETGIYEVKFNTSSLAEGVYFYHLKADGINVTKKLMIVK